MPDSRLPGNGNSRLPRIQLPGVDVERSRNPSHLGRPKCPLGETIRQKAEIPTPARGHQHLADTERRGRELAESASLAMNHIGILRTTLVPISGTIDREKARVIGVSLLDQDVESPFTAANDRETRRAIALHALTGDVLE